MKMYTDLNNRHSVGLLNSVDNVDKNVETNTVFLYYSNTFEDTPTETFYNLKVIGITPYGSKAITRAYLNEDKVFISTKSKINEDIHKLLKEKGIPDSKIERSKVEEDGETFYRYRVTYLEKYTNKYKGVAPKWNGKPGEITVENIFPNRGRFIYLGHFRNMDNYDVLTSLGMKYIPAMLKVTTSFDFKSTNDNVSSTDAGGSIMVLEETNFITSFLTSKELKRLTNLLKPTPLSSSTAKEDEAVKTVQDIVRSSHHNLFRNIMHMHTIDNKNVKRRPIEKELLNITKGEVFLLIMKRIDSIIGLTKEEKITAKALTRLVAIHSTNQLLSNKVIREDILKGIKEALR